jgi:hypothetical protein
VRATQAQACVYDRMKHDAAWIGFIGVGEKLPAVPQSVEHRGNIRSVAAGSCPAKRSLDRTHRRLIAALSHEGGEQPVSRGIANADIFCRRGEVFNQARRLAGCNPKRMGNLRTRQAQEFRARGRRPEHAAGRRNVPPARIMTRRNPVADAACNFGSQDQRMENGGARKSLRFRQRQDGGRHRSGRVNDRAQMSVVKVKKIGGGRVDETRAQNIQPVRTADEARVRRAGKLAHDIHRNRNRIAAGGSERTTEKIQQRPFGFVAKIRSDLRPRRRFNKRRKDFADCLRAALTLFNALHSTPTR